MRWIDPLENVNIRFSLSLPHLLSCLHRDHLESSSDLSSRASSSVNSRNGVPDLRTGSKGGEVGAEESAEPGTVGTDLADRLA